MKKKLIAPLIYYFLAIAGFTTSLLCQENNKLFSFSMALMFTMSGSLIGELVSKRVQVPKPTLQKLGKWLLAAILCSVLCYVFMTDITIRNIFIVVINVTLALSTVFYAFTH